MNKLPSRMRKTTAIKLAGSQANLARILGRTTQALTHWGLYIPKDYQWDLERSKPEWFKPAKPRKGA